MKSSCKKLFFILIILSSLGFLFKYLVGKGMGVNKIFGLDVYTGRVVDMARENVKENVMIVDSLRQLYLWNMAV